MTLHEIYLSKFDWSGYLLRMKNDLILEQKSGIEKGDYTVLIQQDLKKGPKNDKLIIMQVDELDEDYEMKGGEKYCKVFLIEPKNNLEVLAKYLIERASADPF